MQNPYYLVLYMQNVLPLLQADQLVQLWLPKRLEPSCSAGSSRMVGYVASMSQSAAASFGARSVAFELTSMLGANVLTVRP